MKKITPFLLISICFVLVGCTQQTPVVDEPETPTVIDSTEDTKQDAIPVSDFVTYERNIYGLGYTFEYSKNWYYENKGKIDLDNIDIVVLDDKPVEDYTGIISFTISNIGSTTLLEKSKQSIGNQTVTDITIDGVEGKQIKGTEIGLDKVVVIYLPFPTEPKNTLIIRLNKNSNLEDFEELLSTFKFTR